MCVCHHKIKCTVKTSNSAYKENTYSVYIDALKEYCPQIRLFSLIWFFLSTGIEIWTSSLTTGTNNEVQEPSIV